MKEAPEQMLSDYAKAHLEVLARWNEHSKKAARAGRH
jgi:hypothetical protein